MPKISYLKHGYPGCKFSPAAYLTVAITRILALTSTGSEGAGVLDMPATLKGKFVVNLAKDGAPEGRCKKHPMMLVCVTFPQDPQCQQLKNCHLLAMARCTESAGAERLHFGSFYKVRKHLSISHHKRSYKKCDRYLLDRSYNDSLNRMWCTRTRSLVLIIMASGPL